MLVVTMVDDDDTVVAALRVLGDVVVLRFVLNQVREQVDRFQAWEQAGGDAQAGTR